MSLEHTSLLISALALLATIVGWRYTYVKQKAILAKAREYNVRDREIGILRDRLKIITEITSTLNLIGYGYTGRLKLYTDGVITASTKQLPGEMKKFTQLISSPDFVFLYNILNEEARARVDHMVSLLNEGGIMFGDLRNEYEELKSKNQDEYSLEDAVVIDVKQEEMFDYARDLSLTFFIAAQGFSSEFMALEREIVTEKYSLEAK